MIQETYGLDKKQNRKKKKKTATKVLDGQFFAKLNNNLELLLSLSQTHCFACTLRRTHAHNTHRKKKEKREKVGLSLSTKLQESTWFWLVLSWVSLCKSDEGEGFGAKSQRGPLTWPYLPLNHILIYN